VSNRLCFFFVTSFSFPNKCTPPENIPFVVQELPDPHEVFPETDLVRKFSFNANASAREQALERYRHKRSKRLNRSRTRTVSGPGDWHETLVGNFLLVDNFVLLRSIL